MADKVWFWGIDGYEGNQLIFQCAVEREKLDDAGVIATLRCLVSRHLEAEDIVVANMGNNDLLEVRQHEPNPKYVKYSCGGKVQYVAALWQSEIT
jgi:hypothetical protein